MLSVSLLCVSTLDRSFQSNVCQLEPYYTPLWLNPKPMAGCIIVLRNLMKFFGGKNWYNHRIQHTRFANKLVSDGEFALFLIDFFNIENRKVGLLAEILEQIWVVKIKQFFLHSKVQPKISIHRKIQGSLTSSLTGNDVIKILKFLVNFRNFENYNPCENHWNDQIRINLKIK